MFGDITSRYLKRDPKLTEPAQKMGETSWTLHKSTKTPTPLSVMVGMLLILFFSGWYYHLFLRTISEQWLPTEKRFLDGLLMRRAASGSWGKIRWMWSFIFRPRIAVTTFKCCYRQKYKITTVIITHTITKFDTLEWKAINLGTSFDFHAIHLRQVIGNSITIIALYNTQHN